MDAPLSLCMSPPSPETRHPGRTGPRGLYSVGNCLPAPRSLLSATARSTARPSRLPSHSRACPARGAQAPRVPRRGPGRHPAGWATWAPPWGRSRAGRCHQSWQDSGGGGSGCGPPAATPTGRSHAGAEPGGHGEAAGGARRRRKSPPGCNYLGTKLLSLPSPPGEISFISYIIPSPRTSPSTPTTAHSSAPTPSPAWAGGWVQGGGRPEVMAHTHQVSPAQDRTLTAGAPSPLLWAAATACPGSFACRSAGVCGSRVGAGPGDASPTVGLGDEGAGGHRSDADAPLVPTPPGVTTSLYR